MRPICENFEPSLDTQVYREKSSNKKEWNENDATPVQFPARGTIRERYCFHAIRTNWSIVRVDMTLDTSVVQVFLWSFTERVKTYIRQSLQLPDECKSYQIESLSICIGVIKIFDGTPRLLSTYFKRQTKLGKDRSDSPYVSCMHELFHDSYITHSTLMRFGATWISDRNCWEINNSARTPTRRSGKFQQC